MTAPQQPHRVAISVAPNGGRKTKADHPSIPLTAIELARTAAECLEAGASTVQQGCDIKAAIDGVTP